MVSSSAFIINEIKQKCIVNTTCFFLPGQTKHEKYIFIKLTSFGNIRYKNDSFYLLVKCCPKSMEAVQVVSDSTTDSEILSVAIAA